MIYLASPYSHHRPEIRKERADLAAFYAGKLSGPRRFVYSPIAHGHAIEPHLDPSLGNDHGWWMRHCFEMLDICDEMIVLTLPGWRQSKGVALEVAFAREWSRPISYCIPQEFRSRIVITFDEPLV